MDCIFTTLGSEDEREQLMHRVLEISLGMLAKNENKKKVRVLDLQSIALLDSSVGDDFLGKVI